MVVTTYRWTLDRYHQAITAGIFEDQPIELLQGELIVMTPEGEPHAYYNTEAADYLRGLLGDRAKVRDAKPITLPNDSEPAPDLAIVKPFGKVYLEHHPYPEDIFWVVEFSQSTLSKDLGVKKTIYAEAGIPEYWVVNLKETCVHVFRDLVQEVYTTEALVSTGTITTISFPRIQFQVQRLMNL